MKLSRTLLASAVALSVLSISATTQANGFFKYFKPKIFEETDFVGGVYAMSNDFGANTIRSVWQK